MTRHQFDRADRVFDAVANFTAVYGHPPSVREIAQRVGLSSPSAVFKHLRTLERTKRVTPCDCGCGRVWPRSSGVS